MIKKNILEYDFSCDLSEMSLADKELLSIQIREFLIDEVSNTGGHLASNLGAVEIIVAIHNVFDPIKDKIIWDVGHQSYVHKILTGRGKYFNTLRQYKGLSGFPGGHARVGIEIEGDARAASGQRSLPGRHHIRTDTG